MNLTLSIIFAAIAAFWFFKAGMDITEGHTTIITALIIAPLSGVLAYLYGRRNP